MLSRLLYGGRTTLLVSGISTVGIVALGLGLQEWSLIRREKQRLSR